MTDQIEATTSSLEALAEQYYTITHNLANTNTCGYKRYCTSFSQALAETMAAPGASDRVEGNTAIDFTQGALSQTGNQLDLSLVGKGFFVIETPEGPLYTRNGCFRRNSVGQLVNTSGQMVAGLGGPIIIPHAAETRVGADGTITVSGVVAGRIRVVDFDKYEGLTAAGGGCFRAPDTATLTSAPETVVRQGYQESSNVKIVDELVGLIAVTRLYQANLRSIQVQDDRMESILQVALA